MPSEASEFWLSTVPENPVNVEQYSGVKGGYVDLSKTAHDASAGALLKSHDAHVSRLGNFASNHLRANLAHTKASELHSLAAIHPDAGSLASDSHNTAVDYHQAQAGIHKEALVKGS